MRLKLISKETARMDWGKIVNRNGHGISILPQKADGQLTGEFAGLPVISARNRLAVL
jgi:hypothetical protein